eukprot:15447056-Alexandrium_andersonii.AAC.1
MCVSRRNVKVMLLIDKAKCLDPPGMRQVEQLELLLQWKVKVRTRTPVEHLHSAQHSKTWLLDRAIHC